mmetsp:Transcript_23927/g.48699  ORF Transcript_23927/g.48699 Transcript_23927/m.48699 type:complete len:548 (-) Transcript_23927:26-1669(-)
MMPMTLSSAFLLFTSLQQALALQQTHQGQRMLGSDSPIWPCAGLECVRKYIALPDAHYSWRDTRTRLNGVDPTTFIRWKGYVLNMTSQKWLTTDSVSSPIQWHTVVVVVPDNLEPGNWANLIIDFGLDHYPDENSTFDQEYIMNRYPGSRDIQNIFVINNRTILDYKPELKRAVCKTGYLATHTRSVSISLFNALNEVQVFKDDPAHMLKSQDLIKAYSWFEFMKYGGNEPERIMELPVAKAVVRTLDTVTDFTKGLPSGEVTNFAVVGLSKLGMATWMTSAIDERVKAIAPVALPPGRRPTVESPRASLIDQSDSQDPYDKVSEWKLQYPAEFQRLMGIIDWGSWINQLTKPVLYVQDTNDAWFDGGIAGVGSWLPMLPVHARVLFVKATHGTALMAGLSGVAAFFRSQRLGEKAPQISYDLNSSSRTLTVRQVSSHTPSSVRLVSAVTCSKFDATTYMFGDSSQQPSFLNSLWNEAPDEVPEQGVRTWVVDLGAAQTESTHTMLSEQGGNAKGCFRGAFVRMEYPGPQPGYDPYLISTPVFTVPV